MRASELRLGYSRNLVMGFDDNDSRFEIGDMDDYSGLDAEQLEFVPSVTHGTKFGDMFEEIKPISLKNRVITAFHFSSDGDFAGFSLKDTKNGLIMDIQKEHLNNVVTFEVDEKLVAAHASTRLVGFRTSLRCRTSQVIQQVQPIYYSVSSDVCSNLLSSIPQGMITETPSFGAECNQIDLQRPITVETNNKNFSFNMQKLDAVTSLFAWILFLLLLAITFFQYSSSKRLERIEKKRQNIEMAEQARGNSGCDTERANGALPGVNNNH